MNRYTKTYAEGGMVNTFAYTAGCDYFAPTTEFLNA